MQHLSVLAFLAVILFAPAIGAREPGWPTSIAVGTASPGGTYYVYGQALAEILSGELGIEVSADAAAGMIIHLTAQSRNNGNLLSAPAP